MSRPLRLAVTADLHWGHRRGREAVHELAACLYDQPPDVLVLAGDVGAGEHFGRCLGLFAGLGCVKVCVPGNHDLWVTDETGHDSLRRYREVLPGVARGHGFHYLDGGPLVIEGADLALVGSINWYDYSWGIEGLKANYPGELERLHSKRFTRGRHNDANYVRWPIDDGEFTAQVVGAMAGHLREALGRAGRAVVVTHHPPFYGLNFPREGPPLFLDSFLWDAFAGNARMEALLARYAERIPLVFCGHTHRARENNLGPIRGYNVGGDYHFKRLLLVDWPGGSVEARTFGEEDE